MTECNPFPLHGCDAASHSVSRKSSRYRRRYVIEDRQ